MNKIDYLIVGQGLAGSILAYTFLKKGKAVKIFDDDSLSLCSKAAAGNYNPLVFKRLVKSWKADEVIPFADEFFREAQQFLQAEFFWKKEIAKVFSDAREKNFWIKKACEDKRYLSEEVVEHLCDGLQKNAGCGIVKDAGKIYSAGFLSGMRKYFLNENMLIESRFDFRELSINGKGVEYKDIFAGKVIFCEGWKAKENPFFNYLPFKPAKGEILVLKIENFKCDKIIHKNGYLYQIGENLFVAGSTYEWNDLDDIPSEKGKSAIIEKLEKIIHIPYAVIGHFAGVRPSTIDRRPFIGLHPMHSNLGIFNGFGTKAVMLSPFFANQFEGFLDKRNDLDEEADINRFNHLAES